MTRAVVVLALFLTGCKADALFGPVQPPCRRRACLDVYVWNSYHQQWAQSSTCWCAEPGFP